MCLYETVVERAEIDSEKIQESSHHKNHTPQQPHDKMTMTLFDKRHRHHGHESGHHETHHERNHHHHPWRPSHTIQPRDVRHNDVRHTIQRDTPRYQVTRYNTTHTHTRNLT